MCYYLCDFVTIKNVLNLVAAFMSACNTKSLCHMIRAQRTMIISSREITGNKIPDLLKASDCGPTASQINQMTDAYGHHKHQ